MKVSQSCSCIAKKTRFLSDHKVTWKISDAIRHPFPQAFIFQNMDPILQSSVFSTSETLIIKCTPTIKLGILRTQWGHVESLEVSMVTHLYPRGADVWMGGCRPKEFRGNGWAVSKDLAWLIVAVRRDQKAEITAIEIQIKAPILFKPLHLKNCQK